MDSAEGIRQFYGTLIEAWLCFASWVYRGSKGHVQCSGMDQVQCDGLLWDGKSKYGQEVASGVYFYQVKAGEFVKHGKMVLVR